MSFVPFGIAPATGRQTKRPKVQPLAEFAEPDDHASEVDVMTEAEKRAEADKLQEEGSEKAEAGEFSAAIKLWDTALLLAPDRAVLHELKAQVFLEIEHHWDAVQSATQATDLNPSWPEAFLTLARAQLAFGEPEAALGHMETVLALQPGHPGASAEIDTVRMLVLRRKVDPSSVGQRLRVV